MKKPKVKQIKEELKHIDARLKRAKEYVAQNMNVEGTTFLHFDDWNGASGHPAWMNNHMIPTMLKHRTRKEKAIERIIKKVRDKRISARKHQGGANEEFC
jgi:hypothetical protein